MKALVTGFHMLYRLSQDSKYPWSGPAVEIPRRRSTDSGTGPIRGPPCMQTDEEEKVEVIHCILRLDHCLLEF